MRLAADHPEAADHVIATGVSHTVRDFVAAAFDHVGISDWERYVVVDPQFFRPVDATELRGDATYARERLGWAPSIAFADLVARMVDADLVAAP
jgi:GDPmannose 4,6-dehydratase